MKEQKQGLNFDAGSHDWSDFHIHMTPAMQSVLCEVISNRVATDVTSTKMLEQHKQTARVECKALLKQYIHFGDTVDKVAQGESSGIGATDFLTAEASLATNGRAPYS